ncbi:MAG: GNAT family N-acetyltransferase [Planctomycetota bacterium]
MATPRRLQTERLLLRCWTPADAELLRDSLDRSDAHLRPYIPFMRHEPRTLDETTARLQQIIENFDAGLHFQYAVFDAAESRLLGEVMLIRRDPAAGLELGYWLDVSAQRCGYATEAASALVQLAFHELGVAKLELRCEPENVASGRLAARLEFVLLRTIVGGSTDMRGDPCDLQVWSLDRPRDDC